MQNQSPLCSRSEQTVRLVGSFSPILVTVRDKNQITTDSNSIRPLFTQETMRYTFGHLLLLVAVVMVICDDPSNEETGTPYLFVPQSIIKTKNRDCPEGQQRDYKNMCREIVRIEPTGMS